MFDQEICELLHTGHAPDPALAYAASALRHVLSAIGIRSPRLDREIDDAARGLSRLDPRTLAVRS
jgi:hypothetical protein